MGDPSHIAIINQGVSAWNLWRDENPRIAPNLTRADLSGKDLSKIDFRGVGLFKANLQGAILTEAILRQARIVETNMESANISGSYVYGTSVWNVNLKNASQNDLIITHPREAIVTVDNLEVAQFIHLLLNNEKIRQVIDTVTSKVVLILGRFSTEQKIILDRIKTKLRSEDYVPVLFDFEGPKNRNLTETITTLARLAKYIIADLTDPSCIPHELQSIVPTLHVPVGTIIKKGKRPYAMFSDLEIYPWVLPPIEYIDEKDVSENILEKLLTDLGEQLAYIKCIKDS